MTLCAAWTPAASGTATCVLISGIPHGGLGNQLFQIAWAVRLAVQHNYRICLDRDSPWLRCGTSVSDCSAHTIGYFDTLWDTARMLPVILIRSEDTRITAGLHLSSDYEDMPVDPLTHRDMIFLSGFAQHLNLFLPTLRYLPLFLRLDQPDRQQLLRDRYGLDRENSQGWTTIMLGVRRREDFNHMKAMDDATYQACLDEAVEFVASDRPCVLVVIADVYDHRLPQLVYPSSIRRVLYITEDDVMQLYAGLCCECIILSESTFHYWIAVLRQSLGLNTHVIVVDDTDLTRRRLIFNTWKIIPRAS